MGVEWGGKGAPLLVGGSEEEHKRFWTLVLVSLLILMAVALFDTYRQPVDSHVQVRCEEDEPCWDCSTMGNKICGPRSAP